MNSPRRKPTNQGFAARQLALEILAEVLVKKQPLDVTLDLTLAAGLKALEPRDRGFARALATITLRRLGQIDRVLSDRMARPLPAKAAAAQNILRLGVAQLIFLETPPHAAVDGAVNMAQKEQTARPFKKLINAVLRNVAASNHENLDSPEAALLNLPGWLKDPWVKSFGAAKCAAIAVAHLVEPPLDLTVPSDREAWAEKLGATLTPTGSLRIARAGNVPDLLGFTEGAWWVQDAAAAIPAHLLGDIKDHRVLDLCAAPGGKTAQLISLGAKVTALDRSAKRLTRLTENLTRLGLAAELVTSDATTWTPPELFPFVLLDAPCSATGTLRRHPDLAQIKSQADVAKLAALQSRLLDAAVTFLAPGGTLLYCTCSMQEEEGEAQIQSVLARHKGLKRSPIAPDEAPGIGQFVNQNGELRTFPSEWSEIGGLDGFFISRLTLV